MMWTLCGAVLSHEVRRRFGEMFLELSGVASYECRIKRNSGESHGENAGCAVVDALYLEQTDLHRQ